MSADPFDTAEWHDFVRHFREDAVHKIAGSAMVASIAPGDEFDVKIACEIGATLLLNKPLIILQLPGRPVPDALRKAAVEVVECDLDTRAGQDHLASRLKALGIGGGS
jgi:hypothetical protein